MTEFGRQQWLQPYDGAPNDPQSQLVKAMDDLGKELFDWVDLVNPPDDAPADVTRHLAPVPGIGGGGGGANKVDPRFSLAQRICEDLAESSSGGGAGAEGTTHGSPGPCR